jgi:hypothetical protein
MLSVKVTWQAHPAEVDEHVPITATPPSTGVDELRSACSIAHVVPLRHEVGMLKFSFAVEPMVAEYVSAGPKVIEPETFALRLNVADGQLIANGFSVPLEHSFVKFHVPTTLPPHGLNDEQLAPPRLELPEHPVTVTQATSERTSQESRTTPSLPK